MIPDSTTTVSSIHTRSVADVLRAVASACGSPNVGFWVITATFLFRPWLLLGWLAAAVPFSSFSSLVYESDFMQRGLLYVFFVCIRVAEETEI
jgi:hypothetical protein